MEHAGADGLGCVVVMVGDACMGWQAQKARTIADLEDQLRDIMFYMDSQRRVAESPHRDEIADGQIIVPAGESPAPTAAGSTPPSSRSSRRRRA